MNKSYDWQSVQGATLLVLVVFAVDTCSKRGITDFDHIKQFVVRGLVSNNDRMYQCWESSIIFYIIFHKT